jgi:phosphoribosylglycinamide formyltransferase-1
MSFGTGTAKIVENSSDPLLGVLVSGRGSNLQALIDAKLSAPIRVVVSNVAGAFALERARAAGIETVTMTHQTFPSRDAFDRALVETLKSRGVTLVCLAGFMRRLGPAFCDAFPLGILNVHPSLLPAFPGIGAQQQALRHGAKVAGATVHFVSPELDGGPIVLQGAVPVRDDDTEDTLSARILEVEHRLYPAAVQQVLDGRWRIDGRRVIFEKTGV